MTDGYRIADDGVLEREIKLPPPCPAKWVPVVPDGYCLRTITWKRWIFLQNHVGVIGGHRNAQKTLNITQRQCWWATMRTDIEKWVNSCITCIRFRKIPQKQLSEP